MPDERTYYVVDEDGGRAEGMTQQQIIEQIFRDVETYGRRSLRIETICTAKELNSGKQFRLWIGTQAEYNALTSRKENVMYIVAEQNAAKQTLISTINSLNSRLETAEETAEENDEDIDQLYSELEDTVEDIQTNRQDINNVQAQVILKRAAVTATDTSKTQMESNLSSATSAVNTFVSDRKVITTLWSGSQSMPFNDGNIYQALNTFWGSDFFADSTSELTFYFDFSLGGHHNIVSASYFNKGKQTFRIPVYKIVGATPQNDIVRTVYIYIKQNTSSHDVYITESTGDVTLHRIYLVGTKKFNKRSSST